MNIQTKTLLKLSIKEFKAAEPSRQSEMLKHVEKQLKNAEYYAPHYVQAGKIFLRLFKPRKVFTLNAYGFRAECLLFNRGDKYTVEATFKRLDTGFIMRSKMYNPTMRKLDMIGEALKWMKDNKEFLNRDSVYFAVQAMSADQQTSINNKL